MVSACNIEDVPSYGGSAFSDIVGGTSPSYTGFSQIGGSKKRRRTKRKRGKRTRHCRCKVCKCKKCRCNKKHSKKGGSRKTGRYAERESEVMELYKKYVEEQNSKRAYDDAEEQAKILRKKGVDVGERETDIVEHVKKLSLKESQKRRSSPKKRRSVPKKRRSSPKRKSRSRENPIRRIIRSLSEYYGKPKNLKINNRTKRITDKPKAERDERARKHDELLKKLGFSTDEQIGKYIDDKTKSKKPVKKARKEVGFVKKIQEVEPDGFGDYKLTGKTFDVIDVGGGGDCFFRVVAYLVFGNENRHSEVRKSMIEWVEGHKEEIINKTFNSIPLISVMAAQLKIDDDNPNKVIDDYCRTMGRRGNWAEGYLEYYFMCRSLLDNYGKKVKMMVYTFPCIPDKRYVSRPCLRNIKDGYRENFCTIAPDGQIQNTLFKDNERGLVTIHVMNKDQGHFLALVSKSA